MAEKKQLLTTIAVLQCVEKGLITLDEPVGRILNEFTEPEILTGFDNSGKPVTHKASTPITLRKMITHTSGMGYPEVNPLLLRYYQEYQGKGEVAVNRSVTRSYLVPLTYEPGTSWEYSCGFDWAGKIVERTTNSARLGDYMKKHIFEPLGMTDTTFTPLSDPDIMARMIHRSRRNADSGKLTVDPGTDYPIRDFEDDYGGNGGYSSTPDYVKVLTSLLRNDGILLRPETVNEMFTPQLPHPDNNLMKMGINTPFGPSLAPGFPLEKHFNFGLGGIVLMDEVVGQASKGTMIWAGLPGVFGYVDRENGVCGFYGSQVFPYGDMPTFAFYARFMKAVLEDVGKV